MTPSSSPSSISARKLRPAPPKPRKFRISPMKMPVNAPCVMPRLSARVQSRRPVTCSTIFSPSPTMLVRSTGNF